MIRIIITMGWGIRLRRRAGAAVSVGGVMPGRNSSRTVLIVSVPPQYRYGPLWVVRWVRRGWAVGACCCGFAWWTWGSRGFARCRNDQRVDGDDLRAGANQRIDVQLGQRVAMISQDA